MQTPLERVIEILNQVQEDWKHPSEVNIVVGTINSRAKRLLEYEKQQIIQAYQNGKTNGYNIGSGLRYFRLTYPKKEGKD